MNDPRFRIRRITVERDEEGTITLAYDADTHESILVDPARSAIYMDNKWYVLEPTTTEITFPRFLVSPWQ